MLRLSLQTTAQDRRRSIAIIVLVLLEIILVTMALIPAQEWTRLLPGSPNAAQDGPFRFGRRRGV